MEKAINFQRLYTILKITIKWPKEPNLPIRQAPKASSLLLTLIRRRCALLGLGFFSLYVFGTLPEGIFDKVRQ